MYVIDFYSFASSNPTLLVLKVSIGIIQIYFIIEPCLFTHASLLGTQ